MTQLVALVTGAASGIGAASALRLAKAGYAIWAVGLDPAGLEATAAQITAEGGRAVPVSLDISDAAAREALFARISAEAGRLDVLVHSAAMLGAAVRGPAIEQSIAQFERIISVNLTAAFAFSQAAARMMRAQGKGAIVFISSVGGAAAQYNASAYCASKAGLDALARNMGIEWAPYGIRVNSVAPGDIGTQTSDTYNAAIRQSDAQNASYLRRTPLDRQGRPAEIAEVVAFLCSDAASFVTASTMRADGGFLSY